VVRGARRTPEILYSLVPFFDAVVRLVLDGGKSSSSEDKSVKSETSDSDMIGRILGYRWQLS
jgi:hypothetical protein